MPLQEFQKEHILRKRGLDPTRYQVNDDNTISERERVQPTISDTTFQVKTQPDTYGWTKTAVGSAVETAPTAAFSGVGLGMGARLGSKLPGPPIVKGAGGIIGALAGAGVFGGIGQKITDIAEQPYIKKAMELQNALDPTRGYDPSVAVMDFGTRIGQVLAKLKQSQAAQPSAAIAGHIATIPLSGVNPSPRNLFQAAKYGVPWLTTGARPIASAGRTAEQEISNIQNVALGTALGPAVETGRSVIGEGELPSVSALLREALIGSIFTKVNPLGRFFGLEEGAFRKEIPDVEETVRTSPPVGSTTEQETVRTSPLTPGQQVSAGGVPMSKGHVPKAKLTPSGIEKKKQVDEGPPWLRKQEPFIDPDQLATLEGEGGINPPLPKGTPTPPAEKPIGSIQAPLIEGALQKSQVGGVKETPYGPKEEIRPFPLESDFTKRQQKANKQVEKESAADLAARQEEARLAGEPPPKYSPEGKFGSEGEPPLGEGREAHTPFEKQMVDLYQKKGLRANVNVWYHMLKSWGARMRNTKVTLDDTITDAKGNPVAGQAVLSKGLDEATVKIHPDKLSPETVPHELFHTFFDFLSKSVRRGDKPLVERALKIVEESAEYKDWLKRRGGKSPQNTPEEFFTTEQGAEFMRRQLNLTDESAFKTWFRDFAVHAKNRFNSKSMTLEDYRRLLQYRFQSDAAFNKYFKTGKLTSFGGAAAVTKSSEEGKFKELSKEDAERYLEQQENEIREDSQVLGMKQETGTISSTDYVNFMNKQIRKNTLADSLNPYKPEKNQPEGKFSEESNLPAIRPGDTQIKIKQKDGTVIDAVTNNQYWQLGERKALNVGTAKDGLWSDRPIGPDEEVIKLSEKGKFNPDENYRKYPKTLAALDAQYKDSIAKLREVGIEVYGEQIYDDGEAISIKEAKRIYPDNIEEIDRFSKIVYAHSALQMGDIAAFKALAKLQPEEGKQKSPFSREEIDKGEQLAEEANQRTQVEGKAFFDKVIAAIERKTGRKISYTEAYEDYLEHPERLRKVLGDLDANELLAEHKDPKNMKTYHMQALKGGPVYDEIMAKNLPEGKFDKGDKPVEEKAKSSKKKVDPRDDSIVTAIYNAVEGSFTGKMEYKDLVEIKKALREQVNWTKSPDLARAINDKTLKPDAKFWQDFQKIYNRDFFPETPVKTVKEPVKEPEKEPEGPSVDEVIEKLPLAPIQQRIPVKEPPKQVTGTTKEEVLTAPKEMTRKDTIEFYGKPEVDPASYRKPEASKAEEKKQADKKMMTDIEWSTIDRLRTPEKAQDFIDVVRREYKRIQDMIDDVRDPNAVYDLRNRQQTLRLQANVIRRRFPTIEVDPVLKFSEKGKFGDRPVEDNWVDETGVTLGQWREGVNSDSFSDFMEKESAVKITDYLHDEIKELFNDPPVGFIDKFQDLQKKYKGLYISDYTYYVENPEKLVYELLHRQKHTPVPVFNDLRKIISEANPELDSLMYRSEDKVQDRAYAHVRRRLRLEHRLQDDEIKEIFANYKHEGRKRIYDLDPGIGYIADIAEYGKVSQGFASEFVPPEDFAKESPKGKFGSEDDFDRLDWQTQGKLMNAPEEGKTSSVNPFKEKDYKKTAKVVTDVFDESYQAYHDEIEKGTSPEVAAKNQKTKIAGEFSDLYSTGVNKKNLPIGRFNVIKSEVDKIADLDHPKAKLVAEAFTDFYREQRNYEGMFTNDASNKLLNFIDFTNPKEIVALDNKDMRQVVNYLYDIEDFGSSSINLTPRQKEIRKVIEDNLDLSATERAKFPLLGTAKVNTLPHIPSREFVDILLNKTGTAKYNDLVRDWHDYYVNQKGLSLPKSKQALEILRAGFRRQDSNLAKSFGFADKVAKLGLPRSARETNLLDIMMRYNNRYARRLAYHKAIELNKPANDALTDKIEGLDTNEHVNNVAEEIAGITEHEESKRTAVAGLVKAGMLGTLTGAKDFTSNLTLGLQHQNPGQAIPAIAYAWANMRRHIAESFQKGVNKPNIGSIEFGEGGIQRATMLARRLRDIINTATGRNHLERWTRATAFGQGKFLGMDNIMAAHKGNISRQGVKFLDDFGPKDWRNYRSAGVFPEEVLREIAARYVESVQGTYDYRGLPRLTQRGSLSLPLSLARWNVEKFNNFVKYNVEPASRGNITPLLMSTLGMVIGGTAVKALVEGVTGRKEKTSEVKEIAALSKEGKDISMPVAYKLAALSSLSGYTGILGDLVNSGLAYTYGKNKVQMYDNPLLIGINTIGSNALDAVEAAKEGKIEVYVDLVGQIMEDMLQSYRLALPLISKEKREDISRANKMRDLKQFRLTHGYRVSPSSYERPNPFINKEVREFKRTKSPEEAIELLPDLIKNAIDESEGNFDKLKSRLNFIKQNSYQTMPNPDRQLQTFAEYYQFLVKTQGQKEADKRLQDYLEYNLINKAKASLVPSL